MALPAWDMSSEAEAEQPAASSDKMEELTALCKLLIAADSKVEEAELALSEAKAKARRMREEDIPGLMSELGVEMLKLASGEKVEIKDDVYASIPVERKEEAFAWLKANKYDGIIKSEVSVAFGKDEIEKAELLIAGLREQGLEPEFTRGIHPSTLKAFLRERLEAGTDIPLEVFGARPVKQAKITDPAAKKKKKA